MMEKEITTFAPVLIPTLNRYEHFRRCVESLSKCTYADKTELVIGLDYPPSEKYIEGWEKICSYVSTISGFAQVTILKREYNYGVHKNIDDIKEYASTKYDRFILSEDDNEFSPNFLDYINKGLEIYKDNPNIYAICGYNYPIDMSGYDFEYYFSHEFSAWGYGSWFKKQDEVFKIINAPGYLPKFFRDQPIKLLLGNKMRLIPFVRNVGREILGDVYITTYLYSHDIYSVFPKVSMARNWGQDGTGLHSKEMSEYRKKQYIEQPIDDRYIFTFDENLPLKDESAIFKELMKFRKMPFKTKVKNMFQFVLLRLFMKLQ